MLSIASQLQKEGGPQPALIVKRPCKVQVTFPCQSTGRPRALGLGLVASFQRLVEAQVHIHLQTLRGDIPKRAPHPEKVIVADTHEKSDTQMTNFFFIKCVMYNPVIWGAVRLSPSNGTIQCVNAPMLLKQYIAAASCYIALIFSCISYSHIYQCLV